MDVSKVQSSWIYQKPINFVPHKSLIANLKCCDVDEASLKFLIDYLTHRKGHIFINNLFFSLKKLICNFEDDNTLFCCGNNLDFVFINLNSDLSNVTN